VQTGNGMQGIQSEISSWLKSEPKDSASGKKTESYKSEICKCCSSIMINVNFSCSVIT
jgi:hypothetical protein